MSPHIIVAYTSRQGATTSIAETIAAELRETGMDVTLRRLEEVDRIDGYDAAILAGPIYMTRVVSPLRSFLSRQKQALARIPFALVIVSGSAHEHSEKARAGLEKVVSDTLQPTGLRPRSIAHFAGALRPERLGLIQRMIVKMVKAQAGDWRDFEKVKEWTRSVAPLLVAPAEENAGRPSAVTSTHRTVTTADSPGSSR